ncbi:MAG: M15 family metallopeptidase [Candidatus Saccharimonas sp.]
MRASIARRSQASKRSRRRLYLYLAPVLVAALCALFVAFTNWRVSADIQDHNIAQKVLFAKIDAQIIDTKKKRVEAAKAAEALAIANASSAEAKRKADAAANPSGTASNTKTATCDITNPNLITVVVNKKHCFSPATWAPSDLTTVAGFTMRAEAASNMRAMMDTASTAGQGFMISSAYRSYEDQVATFNYWVGTKGSQAEADEIAARPGYSEHQTGLAADFKVNGCALECFGTSSQYQWLAIHASEYGFIRRYPDGLTSITGYEPEAWHWRYVGVTVAQDMKAKGIVTLEAYYRITGGDY